MSTIIGSKRLKNIILAIIMLVLGISIYFLFYSNIYSSISIKVAKERKIEYKAEVKEEDLTELITESNGNVKGIINDINTSIVGTQEVDVLVEKYNICKILSFSIDVVDITAPIIELKNDEITINKGESFNLEDNILSVNDNVDGDLNYQIKDIINEKVDNKYYTIYGEFDNNSTGSYLIEVKAIDKSNNVSSSSFTVNVEDNITVFREVVYASAAPNLKSDAIVESAMSLLGSPYIAFGNGPDGFDCSGFVQYVYSINNMSLSRSASTQAYDGVGVNFYDAMPGDILIWGYNDGTITHSAIYLGNDMMIHAANSSTGVIQSSVTAWERGSNVRILYVRRILN